MTLRYRGRPLTLDPGEMLDQLPQASSRICLFLHGVVANESQWSFTDDPQKSYGSLLEADNDTTSIYVRYNTGLHISTNAQELATLLDDLVTCWPVEVEEISLIGHSMGGLLSRSTCYYGSVAGLSENKSPSPDQQLRSV